MLFFKIYFTVILSFFFYYAVIQKNTPILLGIIKKLPGVTR
jgi:hypothetical protein